MLIYLLKEEKRKRGRRGEGGVEAVITTVCSLRLVFALALRADVFVVPLLHHVFVSH